MCTKNQHDTTLESSCDAKQHPVDDVSCGSDETSMTSNTITGVTLSDIGLVLVGIAIIVTIVVIVLCRFTPGTNTTRVGIIVIIATRKGFARILHVFGKSFHSISGKERVDKRLGIASRVLFPFQDTIEGIRCIGSVTRSQSHVPRLIVDGSMVLTAIAIAVVIFTPPVGSS